MVKQLRPALFLLAILTLLTGVIYPLLVTGIAQLAFPRQANGSLVMTRVTSNRGRRPSTTARCPPAEETWPQPAPFWPRPWASGRPTSAPPTA